MFETSYMGLGGFVWWMGVVENRKDPLNLGRCQIRAFGWHSSNKSDIPTEDLPWAQPLIPVNSSQIISTPKEGDYVMGFFTDGESAQFPIIMGILPGIPTVPADRGKGFFDQRTPEELANSPRKLSSVVMKNNGSGANIIERSSASPNPLHINEPTTSRLYRNENTDQTIIGQRKNSLDSGVSTADPTGFTWNEPFPAYNAEPPYNQVMETESGHVFEMDDTPGSERIHLAHRTGTFTEIYPSGTKVEKVVKNSYQIVLGDDLIHIMGRVNITVDSDVNLLTRGDINIIGGNNISAKIAGDVDFSVGGDFNIRATNFNVDLTGTSTTLASTVNIDSTNVNINEGVSTSAGLPDAPDKTTKNHSPFQKEPVPIPVVVNSSNLSPEQGDALIKSYNSASDPTHPSVADSVANTKNIVENVDAPCIPVAQLSVSQTCIDNISKYEGFRSDAYPDPGTGGEPITIGYGFTAAALGRPVQLGDTITRDEANKILTDIVNNKYGSEVKRQITAPCLTQGQFDALVSFTYNVGEHNLSTSTALRLTNIGDKAGAADALLAWNKSNGKVLPGLVARREAEKAIYLA